MHLGATTYFAMRSASTALTVELAMVQVIKLPLAVLVELPGGTVGLRFRIHEICTDLMNNTNSFEKESLVVSSKWSNIAFEPVSVRSHSYWEI